MTECREKCTVQRISHIVREQRVPTRRPGKGGVMGDATGRQENNLWSIRRVGESRRHETFEESGSGFYPLPTRV